MIFEKTAEIIAEQLGVDVSEITLESDFKNDLNADSLSLFQIINEIEEAFDIRIEETEGIKTVGDAVALIESQTSK